MTHMRDETTSAMPTGQPAQDLTCEQEWAPGPCGWGAVYLADDGHRSWPVCGFCRSYIEHTDAELADFQKIAGRQTHREWAEEILQDENEEALFADGYDEAIVGITWGTAPVVVYDAMICIQILMRDGASEEDAYDHFGYNTIRSLAYQAEEGRPVFVTFRDGTVVVPR